VTGRDTSWITSGTKTFEDGATRKTNPFTHSAPVILWLYRWKGWQIDGHLDIQKFVQPVRRMQSSGILYFRQGDCGRKWQPSFMGRYPVQMADDQFLLDMGEFNQPFKALPIVSNRSPMNSLARDGWL
jgi:hypothetical protein